MCQTMNVPLPARSLALCAVMFLASLAAAGCDELFGPPRVTVTAEVLEADAPVAVEASAVEHGEQGRYQHTVRVEWRGDEPVTLDDARFTHHVRMPDGSLVIAGRGCGVEWAESRREVMHLCTADLQIIEVAPRDAHEYPVHIYPRLGPLRLEPRTYVVEETVAWWFREDDAISAARPDGEFTIRLTYEVGTRREPTPGGPPEGDEVRAPARP